MKAWSGLESPGRYFGPLSTSPVVLLLSPGMTRLSSLIQECADNRNVTVVASFLKHGGPWCTDTSLSPFLVKLVLTFLDNPLKDEVIHVACAPFPVFLTKFYFPVDFPLPCFHTALEKPAFPELSVTYPRCERCWWLSSGQLSGQCHPCDCVYSHCLNSSNKKAWSFHFTCHKYRIWQFTF